MTRRAAHAARRPPAIGASVAEPDVRLVRIDARLVHATTLTAWVPFTCAEVIVVGDSALAADPVRRAIAFLAARGHVDVEVAPEREVAAALLRVAVERPAMVLFATIEAAVAAYHAGFRFTALNIGHVPDGRTRRRRRVCASVYLGPQDLSCIEELEASGVRVEVRALPADRPVAAPRPGRRRAAAPRRRKTA